MEDIEQITPKGRGLLVAAPAKLNLSLLIKGKRPDGFHEIETIMAKVSLYDELLIEPGGKETIELKCTGPYWAPEGPDNLVYQACEQLLEYCKSQTSVRIELKKNIPAGSGLGSASSDAAAALLGLNRLLGFGLSTSRLSDIAARLGSDVPFFLNGPLAFCSGKGEKIKKINKIFDFSAILILPDVSVSTKMVYKNYEHDKTMYNELKEKINNFLEKKRIDFITDMCANMLQRSCFSYYERLTGLKEKIESAIGRRLCLSGSGSSMFCLLGPGDVEMAQSYQKIIFEQIGCKCTVVRNNRW